MEGVLAELDKFLIGMGTIDHIGIQLHLILKEHRYNGIARGEIFKKASGQGLTPLVSMAKEMQAHIKSVHIKANSGFKMLETFMP